MHNPFSMIIASALAAALFFTACQTTPSAQLEIDSIREERAAALAQRDEIQAKLTSTETRTEELAALLLDETEGSAEERAAWKIDFAVLAERMTNMQGQVATLTAAADNLETQERLVKSRDAGEQTSAWLNLIGSIAGGGALGKLLSKFGPSRGAVELDRVRRDMAGIQAAAEAFAKSPSRGATQAAILAEKIAQMERVVGAFSGGLQPQPVPVPATSPPGPTV